MSRSGLHDPLASFRAGARSPMEHFRVSSTPATIRAASIGFVSPSVLGRNRLH
jgi:hypothetical protein